jgi:hypothetical protein
MTRPELTEREAQLLKALQAMKGWVVCKVEPVVYGTGEPYHALLRDLSIARLAIIDATGGNEE